MSLSLDQIGDAFCSYRFVETYPYMADEIKWSIMGREERMDGAFSCFGCGSLPSRLPPAHTAGWFGRFGIEFISALTKMQAR